MKIITISGSARSGKDSTATILKKLMEKDDKRVIVVHYADYLKFLCKEYFGWNGVKDEVGRSLLQRIGTEVCRENNPNIWINVIMELAKAIRTEYDYMLIPDTRFINEINEWGDGEWDNIALKVERPDFDNGLTKEQKNHRSETELNNYRFDYILRARNLEELEKAVNSLWKILSNKE